MDVSFTVRLPGDVHSVPFVRGLCRQALEHVGVDDDVVGDVALALTEACANVVEHAGVEDDYEVQVDIRSDACRIVVRDRGAGFTAGPQERRAAPGSLLERGRGLALMEARMDSVVFDRDDDGHHRVVLQKRLAAPPA